MEDRLTPLQVEILDVVWAHGAMSATDIWRVIAAQRKIARTTILTMISRLETRHWLVRQAGEGKALYAATHDADEFRRTAAASFVKEYFAGSSELLVKSLLGGASLNSDEVSRLRTLLSKEAEKSKSTESDSDHK